jgi:hypothetical protein
LECGVLPDLGCGCVSLDAHVVRLRCGEEWETDLRDVGCKMDGGSRGSVCMCCVCLGRHVLCHETAGVERVGALDFKNWHMLSAIVFFTSPHALIHCAACRLLSLPHSPRPLSLPSHVPVVEHTRCHGFARLSDLASSVQVRMRRRRARIMHTCAGVHAGEERSSTRRSGRALSISASSTSACWRRPASMAVTLSRIAASCSTFH